MNSSNQPLVANQLPVSIDFPSEIDELVITLTEEYKRIASSVNTKEGALYQPVETANFKQHFTPGNPQKFRDGYRIVVDCGALPNATTKNVSTGIAVTSDFRLMKMYGAATQPGSQCIPLPYSDPNLLTNAVSLYLVSIASVWNVRIVTAINFSAFTSTMVTIEYTKNL